MNYGLYPRHLTRYTIKKPSELQQTNVIEYHSNTETMEIVRHFVSHGKRFKLQSFEAQ